MKALIYFNTRGPMALRNYYYELNLTVVPFTHVMGRALARILKLPIIFERAPVIQKLLLERFKRSTH